MVSRTVWAVLKLSMERKMQTYLSLIPLVFCWRRSLLFMHFWFVFFPVQPLAPTLFFFFLSAGGLDTCIRATGAASMSLNTVISSTGTTGEPQCLKSSPSDVCGTCSGTNEDATLPLPQHLPILILPPIPVLTLILAPTLTLIRVPIPPPNPRLNPNLKTTPLPTLTSIRAGKAAGQPPVSSLGLVSVYNIWSRNSGKLELMINKTFKPFGGKWLLVLIWVTDLSVYIWFSFTKHILIDISKILLKQLNYCLWQRNIQRRDNQTRFCATECKSRKWTAHSYYLCREEND